MQASFWWYDSFRRDDHNHVRSTALFPREPHHEPKSKINAPCGMGFSPGFPVLHAGSADLPGPVLRLRGLRGLWIPGLRIVRRIRARIPRHGSGLRLRRRLSHDGLRLRRRLSDDGLWRRLSHDGLRRRLSGGCWIWLRLRIPLWRRLPGVLVRRGFALQPVFESSLRSGPDAPGREQLLHRDEHAGSRPGEGRPTQRSIIRQNP